MEDNLKIFKREYLRNHLLDHNENLNLSLDDQTIFYNFPKMNMSSNGRQPQTIKSGISQI